MGRSGTGRRLDWQDQYCWYLLSWTQSSQIWVSFDWHQFFSLFPVLLFKILFMQYFRDLILVSLHVNYVPCHRANLKESRALSYHDRDVTPRECQAGDKLVLFCSTNETSASLLYHIQMTYLYGCSKGIPAFFSNCWGKILGIAAPFLLLLWFPFLRGDLVPEYNYLKQQAILLIAAQAPCKPFFIGLLLPLVQI